MSAAFMTPVAAPASCNACIRGPMSNASSWPSVECSMTIWGMVAFPVVSKQQRLHRGGGVAQQRQEAVDHFAGGDAVHMGAHIDGRDDRAIIAPHRHRYRAE